MGGLTDGTDVWGDVQYVTSHQPPLLLCDSIAFIPLLPRHTHCTGSTAGGPSGVAP